MRFALALAALALASCSPTELPPPDAATDTGSDVVDAAVSETGADAGPDTTSPCVPACGAGEVCVGGACVARPDAGDLDTGDVESGGLLVEAHAVQRHAVPRGG